MARGFESKSVQDQQDEAERARHASAKPTLTPEQIARQTKKEGLQLSRTSTLNQLQGACDGRYRALLETTLKHIDDELAALESAATSPAAPAADPPAR